MTITLFVSNEGIAHLIDAQFYNTSTQPNLSNHPEYLAGEYCFQYWLKTKRPKIRKIDNLYTELLKNYTHLDPFGRGYCNEINLYLNCVHTGYEYIMNHLNP